MGSERKQPSGCFITYPEGADSIIDMGLEGSHKGGLLIFEGTPGDLMKSEHSVTSVYLWEG
jgi:excinuclease UvrABC ATPase subunit